jgi:hypothetical protein
VVREAEIGSPTSPLVRDLVRSADELRIIRGLVGYASSLASMGAAHGLGAALGRTVPGVSEYLERRGETFTDIVDRKRRQRVQVADDPAPAAASGLVGCPAARAGTTAPEVDPHKREA